MCDWESHNIGVEWTDAGHNIFHCLQTKSIAKNYTSVPIGIVIQRQVQKKFIKSG